MLDAMILDDYHFRDQTITCAKTLCGKGTDEATQWRRVLCATVRESGPLETVTQLGQWTRSRRGRKRQALQGLQGYIGKRLEMLDYPRFLAEDFQIGSGPTEVQCKSLTARLKGRGRRWDRPGLEAHLAINCLYHNSRQRFTCWPQAKMP